MKVAAIGAAVLSGVCLFPFYRFLWGAIHCDDDRAFSRRSAALGWMFYGLWIIRALGRKEADLGGLVLALLMFPGLALQQTLMILGHARGVRAAIRSLALLLSIGTAIGFGALWYFDLYKVSGIQPALVIGVLIITIGSVVTHGLVDNTTFLNPLTNKLFACSGLSAIFYSVYGFLMDDSLVGWIQLATAAACFVLWQISMRKDPVDEVVTK